MTSMIGLCFLLRNERWRLGNEGHDTLTMDAGMCLLCMRRRTASSVRNDMGKDKRLAHLGQGFLHEERSVETYGKTLCSSSSSVIACVMRTHITSWEVEPLLIDLTAF